MQCGGGAGRLPSPHWKSFQGFWGGEGAVEVHCFTPANTIASAPVAFGINQPHADRRQTMRACLSESAGAACDPGAEERPGS